MRTKPKGLFSKLYWQISAIFLIVLIVFTSIAMYVSVQSARSYSIEVNQKLNRELASNTVDVIKPFLDNGVINQAAVEDLVHSMMVINPSIEIYLLDKNGLILSYVAPSKVVKLKEISLEPIQRFLNDSSQSIVYGDDPRNPDEIKIFSAAEVFDKGELMGYIYIVLASQEYISASQMVITSYILGLTIKSIILILIISAVVGLISIWFIVNKLNVIISGIKQFQAGDLKTRISVKSNGDIDQIGIVFNEMAGTIENNIQELKGIDELRKELIGNVSHDLRTPISSIQGYAETLLLKKDRLSDEDHDKYLDIIYNSCGKLQKLVSDLFELSKLQSEQVSLYLEPFSIAELVHDIANKYRLISQKKGVNINTIVSKNIPIVNADISLIDRVLQNLIDNAIRFCSEGDTITININIEKPEQVEIRISDSGEGINPDTLPHIFDRYFTSKNDENSTGLGLAIVKKIIDLHKSKIDVQSIPGKGTSFCFSLPVAQLA